jgi:hypothetical protein
MMGRKTLREVRTALETALMDRGKSPRAGPGEQEVVASLNRFLTASQEQSRSRAKKPKRATGKLAKRA